jgi:ribosomal protein S18 acetylase RimI-like enzyme
MALCKDFTATYCGQITEKQVSAVESYLNRTILQKEKHFARVAIDRKSGEVIGFCLSCLCAVKELMDVIKIDPYQFLDAFSRNEEIGLIKVVTVQENYKRRGIGTRLVKDSIKILGDRESNVICSVGWRSKKRYRHRWNFAKS